MSFFAQEFNRLDATFIERLEILEQVRDENLTGIGEFYHDALRVLITRLPDMRTIQDREAAEASARILARGLGEERFSAAAPELWHLVQFFNVVRYINDGFVMQYALTALGQINAQEFLPHLIQGLDDLNTQHTADIETRRRMHRAAVGYINALEALGDPAGFRPVFFVYTGWYDTPVRMMAYNALFNIAEDPADVISQIIISPAHTPDIKYEALRVMLATNAPDSSKARVASVALNTGWTLVSPNPVFQRHLREMRKLAIDTIRRYGAYDDSVYVNLERSFRNNFVNPAPDFDEIRMTIHALSTLGTDRAVDMLLGYLRELHLRRRIGPWTVNRERQIFNWVILGLGASRTQSMEARMLLTTIQRSSEYTHTEQTWARDALRQLGF